ncbi:MAG TPA: glycosyltransferase family 39 protein, partial [Tepidisphaeraceae bacterium]|nr:glycosyltransferase family 39 protein [Tepidisphaeraceae bacterium]
MLVIACVLSALAGRLTFLQRSFDYDASMFIYLGKSVCDGDRFGHDVIDNKFPSVGLMTSVCWRLFGTNWADYVILQTGLSLIGSLLLARCAARNIGQHARLPTLLAAMVYLNFTLAVYGGFQLETIQVFFSIIAACAVIEAIKSRNFADAFLVGLAAGCAAMLKPTGLAVLVAFGVILLARPGPKRAGLLGMAMLGLCLPMGVVMLYLIRADILRDLPEMVRQISLYASQTPVQWEDFFKPITVLVLIGFGLVIRGWVFRREEHRAQTRLDRSAIAFAVIWFILEFIGAVMQRRMYAYHFLPMAAPAALLFGILPRKSEAWPIAMSLGPIILISVYLSMQVQPYPDPPTRILPLSAYLLEHASPGDAVWQDNLPRVLLETNLRPGSRFPIMFLFGNHDSAALEYMPIMLADFERRKPKFMILPSDVEAKIRSETELSSQLSRSPVRARNFGWAWRQIESYVKGKYVPAEQMGDQTIY